MIEVYETARDVRHFPAFHGVAEQLRALHDRLWSEWVPAELQIPPAEVCMQVREITDAFYDRKSDRIYLYLVETDIEDVEAEPQRVAEGKTRPSRQTRGLEWSLVTGQLLHEMMHEYQYKVVKEPTEEGERLQATTRARFVGAGHDARFYTAIATLAPYFDLSPEEFAREL